MNMQVVRWVACVSALTALLLMSNHSTTAARSTDAIGDLHAFITKALKEYQVPGAAVAVVQDGTLK
jgi:CubicO group peptidase (beta-lactamase class C family)